MCFYYPSQSCYWTVSTIAVLWIGSPLDQFCVYIWPMTTLVHMFSPCSVGFLPHSKQGVLYKQQEIISDYWHFYSGPGNFHLLLNKELVCQASCCHSLKFFSTTLKNVLLKLQCSLPVLQWWCPVHGTWPYANHSTRRQVTAEAMNGTSLVEDTGALVVTGKVRTS